MKPTPALRALQSSLAAARDTQIATIVAMVDALPHRGDADALIAPLRPRLAILRPPRRLSFNRLLFTPIDPLIASPHTWRPGQLTIPRNVLIPIAAALRTHLPDIAERIDELGRLGSQTEQRVAEQAAALWPRAATALGDQSAIPGWAKSTGLADAAYPGLATAITAVLAVAADIQAVTLLGQVAPEGAIRTILGRTAPRGPLALTAVIAVLLARLHGSGQLLALATEATGSLPQRVVEGAVDHTLTAMQADVDSSAAISASLAQAAIDTARIVGVLREIDIDGTTRPERRRRIERLRRDADALCRARFDQALQGEFLDQLDSLPAQPSDDAVLALEARARLLRRLETNGRQLGGGEYYDMKLRGCLAPFQNPASPLTLQDRTRLVEILVGPEPALALLAQSIPAPSPARAELPTR